MSVLLFLFHTPHIQVSLGICPRGRCEPLQRPRDCTDGGWAGMHPPCHQSVGGDTTTLWGKSVCGTVKCFVSWNYHVPTLIMMSWPHIPDAEWAEWGIIHRAFGVSPPHPALPPLHHPAVAFPSHPLLLLPGPPSVQRPYAPLPGSRLPSSQCRHSPEETGAHHWRRVPGLHGELKNSSMKSAVTQVLFLSFLICSHKKWKT